MTNTKTIYVHDEPIHVERIKNDVNGNPRYVVWWGVVPGAESYDEAVKIAKERIGGKKYRGRDFGGGIVFQSYDLEGDIKKLVSRD